MKKRIFIIIALLSFLIAGCLEYNEKMKLNNDGSGEITFSVGINEMLASSDNGDLDIKDFNADKIKEKYEGKDGVKVIDSKSYTKNGSRWIETTIAFESLEKFQKASADSSNLGLIGQISLNTNNNGDWVFTRKIFGDKLSADQPKDSTSLGIAEAMFSNYKWQYELELPSNIISTNANDEDVDFNHNTIRWNYNMAAILSGRQMTATFAGRKSSDILYVIIGGFLLLGLSTLSYFSSKKKKAGST